MQMRLTFKDSHKGLSFDETHYKQYLRSQKRTAEEESPTRRRKNPLGDFKFKRINELF
jgi:hypothetical protein